MDADKKHKKKQKQKQKERPSQKFKQLCKQELRKQPPIYLLSSIKDKTIMLDLDLLQPDDVVFVPYMFRLLITRLHMFCQESKKVGNGSPIYATMKFKDVLKEVANAIVNTASFKSLTFERVPLTARHLMMLKQSLQASQNLKQLSFRHCLLTDEHLQVIKTAIAKNESLVILDLSSNKLRNVGSMVGKIMSDHSSRRDELIWFASLRGQPLMDDLSKKGICEVNLENNELDDKSAIELVSFLKDDQWSRCLNLRENKLSEQGIKQFAKLIKKNSSLISLDLRGNPGFTKEYSLYILKKLKQNIEKYKQEKKGYLKNKKVMEQQITSNQNKKDQHKSLEQSRHQSLYRKAEGPAALEFTLSNNNNITSLHQSRKSPARKLRTNADDQHCVKCKQSTLDILKLSKRNLDLQLQIKRLKHILLTKNIDISAILPHSHTHINLSTASQMSPEPFHRTLQLVSNPSSGQSDEELLLKVEQILMELTRIMDNMEVQQTNHNHTQINLSNNISNAHSLSNTIPLFIHPEGLEQLEIEDESSIDKMPMQNSNSHQRSIDRTEQQDQSNTNKNKLKDNLDDNSNINNNKFAINIKNQT